MQIQQYKTVNVGIGRRRLFGVGNVVTIWIRIGPPALMASWFCGPAIRQQRVLNKWRLICQRYLCVTFFAIHVTDCQNEWLTVNN